MSLLEVKAHRLILHHDANFKASFVQGMEENARRVKESTAEVEEMLLQVRSLSTKHGGGGFKCLSCHHLHEQYSIKPQTNPRKERYKALREHIEDTHLKTEIAALITEM